VETSHAEVKIDLLDADDLTYSIEQIKGSIRKYLETVPGLSRINSSKENIVVHRQAEILNFESLEIY